MKQSIFLILHNIRSLYNIGSIFRCADAFGVEKIYLTGYSAYPVHRQIEKIAKTALGAEHSVPWEYFQRTSSVISQLKKQGVAIVSLEIDKKAEPIQLYKLHSSVAIIVGNEVKGISKNILDRSDEILYIPQKGKKESLNVSQATSIALYALNAQRK